MGATAGGTVWTSHDWCRKARALTDEQRQRLADEIAGWRLAGWVRRCVRPEVVKFFGIEECLCEAYLLVVRAASIYDPADGRATLETFAKNSIRLYLPTRLSARARRRDVWHEMPQFTDDDGGTVASAALALEDHRRAVHQTVLGYWCSEDARRERACLGWRARLVLYLRFVEGWTLKETAAGLGVTRERVRQIQDRATERMRKERA